MRWILVPPADADILERCREPAGIPEECGASLIGRCYYYIAVRDCCPELRRFSAVTGAASTLEIIDHEIYGISTGEMEHTVYQTEGDLPETGDYRLSGHIEKKLRAQLDP